VSRNDKNSLRRWIASKGRSTSLTEIEDLGNSLKHLTSPAPTQSVAQPAAQSSLTMSSLSRFQGCLRLPGSVLLSHATDDSSVPSSDTSSPAVAAILQGNVQVLHAPCVSMVRGGEERWVKAS